MKKGVGRILIGIILIAFQLMSVLGIIKAGNQLPGIHGSGMGFLYDSVFFISYYIVGIIGTIVFASGISSYKKYQDEKYKYPSYVEETAKQENTIPHISQVHKLSPQNIQNVATTFEGNGTRAYWITLCVMATLIVIVTVIWGCFYDNSITSNIKSEPTQTVEPTHIMMSEENAFDPTDLIVSVENEDFENALAAAYFEGLCDGMAERQLIDQANSDIDYIVRGILEEAGSYAIERTDGISLWDAMDIVSVYLDGYDPSGYPLPTKREFEEAVDVLLRYAMFLEWNTESFSSIIEDYDPLYG